MNISTVATARFAPATRVHRAFTASAEKRCLQWMAERTPAWVTSDQLTLLGLVAQILAGAFYALARYDIRALWLANACLLLNWFGDSMDGTLARVRHQQRPRYGFYVDHMVDSFGAVALMLGLGWSSLVHWPVAIAMLLGFQLLAAESFLATYTLGRFEMSQGLFGPTEIRLLLMVGNFSLLHSAFCTVLRHRMLLFDLGGTIASVAMLVMVITVTIRHTAELFQQERLP